VGERLRGVNRRRRALWDGTEGGAFHRGRG
jgi:hypothetical protein